MTKHRAPAHEPLDEAAIDVRWTKRPPRHAGTEAWARGDCPGCGKRIAIFERVRITIFGRVMYSQISPLTFEPCYRFGPVDRRWRQVYDPDTHDGHRGRDFGRRSFGPDLDGNLREYLTDAQEDGRPMGEYVTRFAADVRRAHLVVCHRCKTLVRVTAPR